MPVAPGFALLFPALSRPAGADIARLAAAHGDSSLFTITHDPSPEEGMVEVLACGLTFDLVGLAPGAGEPVPAVRHHLSASGPLAEPDGLAAVRLVPGPHLAGAGNVMPVVRTMAGIAAALATLPGLTAIVWEPAAAAMAPEAFARLIAGWTDGGAFPALGLTALVVSESGAVTSEGLAFFTGQEILIEPRPGLSPRDSVRIAVRLIDALVEAEPVWARTLFTGPNGEKLVAEPDSECAVIRIRSEG